MELLNQLIQSFDKNAERIAFCIKDINYEYSYLQKRTYDIINIIHKHKSSISGDKIALNCYDSIDTYASIFAIWLSGYAYVPLGWDTPLDRKLSILKKANINTIISDIQVPIQQVPLNIIYLKDIKPINKTLSIQVQKIDQEHIAYVLFTSGSTGEPKGVPITFKNISSFVDAFDASPFQINSSDRCLQMFELTFDVSISSFLIALLKGASVYTVPNDVIKYLHVIKLISKYNLTKIQIVPSIIRLSSPILSKIILPSVSQCILTGEATSIDLIPIWKKVIPNATIYNYYGPTEATIYCSFLELTEPIKSYNGMLAIGKPLKDMDLLIVNENGEKVNPQEKGELLIAGPQLTSGYINNVEKNASSFITKTSSGILKIYYKSGDMCFIDKDFDIFYCGRFDNQVKIQGFRVELSEIEINVKNRFGVECIAVAIENKAGMSELHLALESPDITHQQIIQILKEKLPSYMIPINTTYIKQFPLTSSGKIDRNSINSIIKNICNGESEL